MTEPAPGWGARPADTQHHTDAASAGSGAPLWPVLVWGLLGGAVAAVMAPLEPSLLEEGLMLHVAQRLADGANLYSDVMSITGPFPYELLALGFQVFGDEIWVARAIMVIFQALSVAVIFAWARRAGSGAFAHAAAASLVATPILFFPLFTFFFYTTVAFHLCVLAGYAALRSLENSSTSAALAWGLAAGFLIACTALSKQTIGVLLALGLVLTVAANAETGTRVRKLGALFLGGAVSAIVVLGVYWIRGELGDVFYSLVVEPFALGDTYESPYVNFWPLGEFSPQVKANHLLYLPNLFLLFNPTVFIKVGPAMIFLTQALFALPWLALFVTGLRRLGGPLPVAVWLHAAILVAVLTNLYPRADWGHLVFVLPMAFVQVVLALGFRSADRCREQPELAMRRTGVPGWGVTGVLLLAFVSGAGAAGYGLHAMSIESNYGPRIGARPVSMMMRNAGPSRVIRFLRQNAEPGEEIFVARSEPLVYFATDTVNPTPFGGVIPGHREEQEAILLPVLERIRFVVMSDIDQPLYTYYSDELPAVQAYLERYFEMPPYFAGLKESWVHVLVRGEDRGPTVVDFFDDRDQGRYWVRGTGGAVEPAPETPARLAAHFNRRPLSMLLGPRGGGVDFDVDVPEAAFFQGDVGLEGMTAADDFFQHPRNTRLVVQVRREGEPNFQLLHAEPVLSKNYVRTAGRDWTPVEVDLSDYGGERVTLRLAMEVDRLIQPGRLSWWGSPRIALRPGTN